LPTFESVSFFFEEEDDCGVVDDCFFVALPIFWKAPYVAGSLRLLAELFFTDFTSIS